MALAHGMGRRHVAQGGYRADPHTRRGQRRLHVGERHPAIRPGHRHRQSVRGEVTVSKDGLFNAGHISMASVRWVIGGIHYACPSAEQLRQLKNGGYAFVFSLLLHQSPTSSPCTGEPPPSTLDTWKTRELTPSAPLESWPRRSCAGTFQPISVGRHRSSHHRGVPPSQANHGSLARSPPSLASMVQAVVGVEASKVYTVHSFRIYLAYENQL